jgi:hypothetical protein
MFRVVSVVKMATLFEVCITEEQRSGVHFGGGREVLSAKDAHK